MNLSDLNKQQLKAVELIGGPILIFAGAWVLHGLDEEEGMKVASEE